LHSQHLAGFNRRYPKAAKAAKKLLFFFMASWPVMPLLIRRLLKAVSEAGYPNLTHSEF